jgi:hypothetical protein
MTPRASRIGPGRDDLVGGDEVFGPAVAHPLQPVLVAGSLWPTAPSRHSRSRARSCVCCHALTMKLPTRMTMPNVNGYAPTQRRAIRLARSSACPCSPRQARSGRGPGFRLWLGRQSCRTGSEMGAAVSRQLRPDAVMCADRGGINASELQKRRRAATLCT